MGAYVEQGLRAETLAELREDYRTSHFFEWLDGDASTARDLPVVYILGFKNGVVKVGQTRDFITRLTAHRSDPLVRTAGLFCGWRLGSDSLREDERTLLRLAGDLGGTPLEGRPEWFTGVAVAALVAAAELELVSA